MKQLIIGIDGGDESILSRMKMPFLNGLLQENHTEKFTEDLLSRGWVEILSGKYARDTKAFYMVPQCNGTPELKFKYSLTDLLSNEEVTPIWRVPPTGSRVAMMNVPTTFPAQEVDGFFVSGAGGGVNKVDGIPPELCYPQSIVPLLEQSDYKIDIRFGTAGITEIDGLFDQLCSMLEKRAEVFQQLFAENPVDFAFVCFRAPTVVQYLAMSEMCNYFAQQEGKKGFVHEATEKWKRGFERLYLTLDTCIEKTLQCTSPEHWILTSDHGAVPYRYRLNIHRFLQDHGFQSYKTNWAKSCRNLAAGVVKGRPIHKVRESVLVTAKAFGNWYFTGIMVNDERRFGGPIRESEVAGLTREICSTFNSTPEAKKYEMEARPYRSLYEGSKYCDRLPDVKIHCSDEIFFSPFPGDFIRENPGYGPLPSIKGVKGGMHSGQKGRHPLFCCDKKTAAMIREDDALDLTLVHKLTERIFS